LLQAEQDQERADQVKRILRVGKFDECGKPVRG